MSCNVTFDKSMGFECVQDIILDVRNNRISVDTVKKGLWVLGCNIEFFSPRQVIGNFEENKTLEQLCDEVEASLPQQGFGSEEQESGNPLIWIGIAQLVWQIIQSLRDRR
jgi:hypothetical protein